MWAYSLNFVGEFPSREEFSITASNILYVVVMRRQTKLYCLNDVSFILFTLLRDAAAVFAISSDAHRRAKYVFAASRNGLKSQVANGKLLRGTVFDGFDNLNAETCYVCVVVVKSCR